jgi:hypothetical protein
MTREEKLFLIRWIIQNVTANVVPCDEGSDEGLIFNLVSMVLDGECRDRWEYTEEQQLIVDGWAAGNLPEV